MINRLSAVAAVAAVVSLSVLAACSSDAADIPEKKTPSSNGSTDDGTTTDPTPNGSSGAPTSSGGPSSSGGPIKPEDKSSPACQLPELTATEVAPSFLVYEPPGTEPPAAKGGSIQGKYTIDKATVYLPTSTKNLVRPAESTGSIKGWAIFNGKNYRLSLNADLQVQSIIGAQPQKFDVVSQGTFATEGAGVKLLTACPGSTPSEDEVSFSENGTRGTLLVKHVIEGRGDSYLLLEATRVQ